MGTDCASLWIRKGRPCNLTDHWFAATDRRGGATLELLEPSYGDKGAANDIACQEMHITSAGFTGPRQADLYGHRLPFWRENCSR
jgi:hypothetical protein